MQICKSAYLQTLLGNTRSFRQSYLVEAVVGSNARAEQDAVKGLPDHQGVLGIVQNDRHCRYGGPPQQHEHLALHALQVPCMRAGPYPHARAFQGPFYRQDVASAA